MPRADASRRRCAIYTRKSSEEGLEQEFNSLAAQREACEAYIRSQQHEGWLLAKFLGAALLRVKAEGEILQPLPPANSAAPSRLTFD